MGAPRRVFALLLIAVMVLSIAAVPFSVVASASSTGKAPAEASGREWMLKVDPRLLGPGAYSERGHLPVGKSVETVVEQVKSELAHRIPSRLDGKARVIVFFRGGSEAVQAIKSIATVTSGAVLKGASSGYLIAWVDRGELERLAKLPYVVSIVPDEPHEVPQARGDALYEQMVGGPVLEPEIYGAVDIMGAKYAWSHGYTGEGVKVAVVDTGVDVGSSDLGNDALARDEYGRPLLFDADEVGLTLTLNPTTYTGNGTVIINPLTIGNYSGVIYYDGYDGSLYIINSTVMLVYDTATGNYTVLAIPVVGREYGVPPEVTNNSTVMFGLASQNLYVGRFFVWYLAPVINVDLDGDGTFDGVYVDLSTTYFLFMYALYQLGYADMPNTSLFDLSFADEQLLNYNNPVAARDFTGDGVNDFSLGAIAGAFNDANGVFGEAYSLDWYNDWENLGYILPGYDKYYGQWVDFEFDWESHGTYCAHVIASRGRVPRPLGYGQGYYNLTGVAPGALIGGASALWNGNVIIAELYLSGLQPVDPENFTWAYTGATQADVISNSWGSSYLLINGYASDADPTSLYEDAIVASTGTIIVHAAGNGGPGYGSVTMAGSATDVITVGASTEFLYRPVYGYLPGAYYQVVSWSDRGPTQFAYPKPDVVNIGSFAWAVGRPIDGLGDGVYAFDLFGGTSEATPMTSGAVAILIQALRDNGYTVTPSLVKTLLKSSAKNLGYDAFTQGSGHVDLRDAINRIESGGFIVASDAPYSVARFFDGTAAALFGVSEDTARTVLGSVEDTAVYFGVVKPGSTASSEIYVEPIGPAANTSVEIEPVTIEKYASLPISKLVDLSKAVLLLRTPNGYQLLRVPNEYVAVLGSYIFVKLNELPPGSRLLIPMKESVLDQAYFAQINAYYPYKYMDPLGRRGTYNPMLIMGVETSYWIDYNNDSILVPQETARIQYDIRLGNAFHVPIGKPAEAFQLAAQEALEYLQKYYGINATSSYKAPVLDVRFFVNAWYGSQASVVLPLKVSVDLYKKEEWTWINVTEIGEGVYRVNVTVPPGTAPGVYEGFLKVYNSQGETYVPVTVAVPFVVAPGKPAAYPGKPSEYPYQNYVFTGALDQGWRPETGDWRVYPVVIEGNEYGRIPLLKVQVFWSDPSSSFDVGLIGAGVNYWGVGDMNYTAWIDAAVVAAKISGLARYAGASGVYTYFDYPTKTSSAIIGPIAPGVMDDDAGIYWIVVHQIFQGKDPDRISILITPLSLTRNTVSVKPGSTSALLSIFYSADLGESYMMGSPMIVPLSGGSPSDINVTLLPGDLPAQSMKRILLVTQASPTASGYYLVIVPYISMHPSVIWGYNANNTAGTLVSLPTIYDLVFLVRAG